MARPSTAEARQRLQDSFALDRTWEIMMGSSGGDTKEEALRILAEVLEKEGVPYAVIGGLAVQLHTEEPRTTRDIDVALASYADLPRAALTRAGFNHEGRHKHSDNWRAPGPGPRKARTAVQFTVDRRTPDTVARAQKLHVLGMRIRVAGLRDLLLLKLDAAEEPRRRPSKRLSDASDIARLLEEHPALDRTVPHARQRLARVLAAAARE